MTAHLDNIKSQILHSYDNLLKAKAALSAAGFPGEDPLYQLNPQFDCEYWLDDGVIDSSAKLFARKSCSLSVWPKNSSVLELGIGNATFASHIFDTVQPSTYHGVDISQDSIGKLRRLISSFHDHPSSPGWQAYKADSIQFLKHAMKNRILYDVIYVDDLHTYQHVSKESEMSASILNVGGLLVFNDYLNSFSSHEISGVKSAVRQFVKQHPNEYKIVYYCIEDADICFQKIK